MRRLNRKGFTLIELLIAITILGIVLSIGYGIINGANKSINEQSKVFTGQMSINTVRDFLVKDLEQSRAFVGITDKNGVALDTKQKLQTLVNSAQSTNKEEYIYKIKINNPSNPTSSRYIEYKVVVEKEGTKYRYDLVRIEKQETTTISTIEIITNQLVNFDQVNNIITIPFMISNSGSKYNIEVGYEQNNKQNVYKFGVSSRYF